MTIYVKVDMSHNRVQNLIDLMTTRFAEDFPDNILSVEVKQDGSVAWVKLNFIENIPGNLGGAILDTAEPGQEHTDKVKADMMAPGWHPPDENPGQ